MCGAESIRVPRHPRASLSSRVDPAHPVSCLQTIGCNNAGPGCFVSGHLKPSLLGVKPSLGCLYQYDTGKHGLLLLPTDVGVPSGDHGRLPPNRPVPRGDVHTDCCTDHVECGLLFSCTMLPKYLDFLTHVCYPKSAIYNHHLMYMTPTPSQMSPHDRSGEELEANHSSRLYRNLSPCLHAGFIKRILKCK